MALQIVLALYFEVVLWFPLGSWNDQPGKRLSALLGTDQAAAALGFALAMLLPVLLFTVAYRKRWAWLFGLSLIGYGTWAALQVQSWWVPWIFGADERALSNQRFLERTYKVFPSSAGHPAPDGMHLVLDLLLFAVVGTLALGLLELRRRPKEIRSL